jgi:murein DD-endopeptidase MepM/ murein hydrolase activator NlpD
MIFPAVCRARLLAVSLLLAIQAVLFAQEPFRFPTANHYLFEPGKELEFFAPTAPDKPWTSGSFGCVRDNGQRIHEGLDIRCLQRDKRGEPTDPVMATADGTVVYFNIRSGLSNFGNYIVLRHSIDGMEIYSLYGHLRQVRPGLQIGQNVKAGDVIGAMGRTANTAERIAPWRAHVHFQLSLLVNDRFAAWFKQVNPRERNDHGEWNGFNLDALDAREILLDEHAQGAKFNMVNFIRGQTELCRVVVRATDFPFLKRYPMLVLPNPAVQREGVAGYEIALNFNATPFQLMPLAASEIKSPAKFQLLSVNASAERANPCHHLVVQRRGHWELTETGLRELELLTY